MVLALLTAAVPASGAVIGLDALPPGDYVVRAVRVEGARRVPASAVRAVMTTQVPPWWNVLRRWRDHRALNPSVLQADLERVRALLRQRGYYEATVTGELEADGHDVTVVVRIDEGPVVVVADVTLVPQDFAPDAAETAALHRLVTLAAGEPFTQAAYDASRAALAHHLQTEGHAHAVVEKAAVVDVRTGEAQVTFTLTRGASAVFGDTTIRGLAVVEERLVRRELAWQPGERWDPDYLVRTQQRVFGLRLFRSVEVRRAEVAPAPDVVDVVIEVVEGPWHQVEVGVGYGLEDGPRGQVRWQNFNFLGGGRQLGVRVKGSEIEQTVEGAFLQPYFLHPAQTLVVPLTTTRENEPAYQNKRVRLAPRVDRRLSPFLTLGVGYNIEYDDLSDVPLATRARLDEFQARGWVSSVTAVLERNTTVDLFDPHHGSVVVVAAEQAGGPWQGDFTFWRATIEGKRYVDLPRGMVLAGRARIGTGDGFGQSKDLPMFRRFYAGGINSTRGYERWQVGPRNQFGRPVGGRSVLEGGLELRTPLPFVDKLGAAVFADVGEVRRQPFSWTADKLQFGVGAGLRYQTIVGPVRVDVGVPLDRPSGEPHWVVQFSIGQAF